MTVNFYLDKNKKHLKDLSIYVFVRGIGGTVKLRTGERINPKFWDVQKQQARRSYVGCLELNSYLNKLREEIKRVFRTMTIDNNSISFDEIKAAILRVFEEKKPVDRSDLFFEAFDLFIETKTTEKGVRTIAKYKTLRQHLRGFEEAFKRTLTFEAIDHTFYDQFTSYLLKDLQHTNNTLGKYISTLKTFLYWASDRGYNEGSDFRKFKAPDENPEIIYLTEDELLHLYHFDLSENTTLAKVRDVFCFGCFTGQRFSDIARLKREDIKGSTWHLHTVKTKDGLMIPLNDFAVEILDRYKECAKVLPIISSQKTNQYLKGLGKLAGIDEPITIVRYRGAERIEMTESKYQFMSTHTARRTFVTLSLEKGMRPETVMEITGHKDYKTLKKYIKITSKVKEIEMNHVWRKEPALQVVNL